MSELGMALPLLDVRIQKIASLWVISSGFDNESQAHLYKKPSMLKSAHMQTEKEFYPYLESEFCSIIFSFYHP